jgi:guanylate kinase
MENLKNVVSIFVKTESGDDYHYVYNNIESTEDIISRLKKDFNEEFAYIDYINVNDSLSSVKVNISEIYEEISALR